MRKATFALIGLSFASPAVAGQPYVGIEAGVERFRANDVDETVEYRSIPLAPGEPSSLFYDDVFSVRYKRGFDLGMVAGFDFGWFRIEGELAHKRVSIQRHTDDDITGQFLSELNGELNRPSQAPDPGAPGLTALTLADFQPSGTLRVGSAMVNALVDVKVIDRLNIYAGIGIGRSFVRGFDDHDSSSVGQRIVGARYALSDRFDLGVKYRNFRTGMVKLDHDPIAYSGNPRQVAGGGPSATQTNAALIPDIEGQFRAKNLLVSLTYNLR